MRIPVTLALALCACMASAQTETVRILPDKSDGPWSCAYYLPNTNADINAAIRGKWYDLTEDESDWAQGFGPFSSEADAFLCTPWGSSVRPLMVRRHFVLTQEEVDGMRRVVFRCSYDENPRAYINGVVLWSASGWNDSNYAELVLTSAQRRKLQAGDNVLAISLQQGGGSGHLDCSLDITYDTTGIGPLVEEEADEESPVFNLAGQRTTAAQHGVQVVGGKKILK